MSGWLRIEFECFPANVGSITLRYLGVVAISWPVATAVITGRYGRRRSPVPGASILHNGIDFRAPVGAAILATQDGTIHTIGNDAGSGNFILIQNDDGSTSGYAHTRAQTALRQGQRVRSSQQIGVSDGSGRISGPHLHYTYRPGTGARPATRQSPTADPLTTQFRGMNP